MFSVISVALIWFVVVVFLVGWVDGFIRWLSFWYVMVFALLFLVGWFGRAALLFCFADVVAGS